MANSDLGHKLTDKELAKLERRIAKLYREAGEELQATIDAYFEQFKKRDEEMKALIGTVQNGKEWTEADYKQWRLNQIGRGERYQAMRDKVAHRVTDANAVAVSYTNDATPGIYSLNRNYSAYTIEQVAGNVGFDLWDEQTVKRLMVEQPDLMPYYPPKRALKRGIDLAYGKKQITKSVTSSILQGKSIKHMADDLQKRITTMSRDSAIRTARTAVTGAQNAGRMDSYAAAEKMGIKLKKEWLATLDARTRHSHAMLDGEQVAQDKKFSNGCRFPGDPQGPPWEIYNCRCTLIAAVDGVDTSTAQRRARNAATGQTEVVPGMSFAEWAGWKSGKSAGNGGNAMPGKPILVKEIDFSDKKAVMQTLEGAEKELAGCNYEVNYSITKDGKVWRVSGENSSVNPAAIPSDLEGSYSYHNHPEAGTNYSFSAEDIAFFIWSGEDVSIASDHLFAYAMRRTKDTVAKDRSYVYNRFKEIERTDVFRMMWDGEIDPDIDRYHEVMKILSKELGVAYERKEKSR